MEASAGRYNDKVLGILGRVGQRVSHQERWLPTAPYMPRMANLRLLSELVTGVLMARPCARGSTRVVKNSNR
jgi:hypothetical protein